MVMLLIELTVLHLLLQRHDGARDAEDGEASKNIAPVGGVADGDLEARRRRLHRNRGGGVVARLVAPTARPVVLPRDERRADGAVRGDLLNAHLLLTHAPGRRDIEARDAAPSGNAEDRSRLDDRA